MSGQGDRGEALPEPSRLSRRVVRGQVVDDVKRTRSREMRQGMTPAERLLWLRLRDNQLGGWHFRRRQIIDGFIADFYCDTAGVIVEVDGEVHEGTADYDRMRDQHLRSRGLTLLRFSNDDVRTNLRAVLQRIAAACPDGRRQP